MSSARTVIFWICVALWSAGLAGAGSAFGQASTSSRTPAPSDTARVGSAAADSLWRVNLAPLVVTATRTARTADDLAVPVSVLGPSDLRAQGAIRLTELLANQPGLTIAHDHGAGLQLRGLGAEYTLILVDGEPVVGRTAGTLDLERLTTANIERIEIVRGPTSSLYGSEALAGVVNLITRRPEEGLAGSARLRGGTHGTLAGNARLEGAAGPWAGSVFVDRYRTDGYDLAPSTLAPTRPGYTATTVQARGRVQAAPPTTLALRTRLATESQTYTTAATGPAGGDAVPHIQSGRRLDWNAAAEVTHDLQPGWSLTGTLYGAGFHTDQSLTRRSDDAVQSASVLDQLHGEAEVVLRAALGTQHLVTAGAGALVESVDADRKTGRRRGGFAFVQDEWEATDALSVTTGARFDANSDYASRLTPKIAARYALTDRLALRASVGSGYKAPAFRQLYLTFTNPQAGYTVLGATEVQRGLQRLQEEGRIQALLGDADALGRTLRAETSVAFNAGLTAQLHDAVTLQLDAYHNEVSNLIDTEPVARKTNGQNVFSYVNRNEVFTRGVEARLQWRPSGDLDVQVGYDYLEAKDRAVLRDLEAGRVYRRVDGRDVRVNPSEYAGLPGRARHSGTLSVRYTVPVVDVTAGLQGTLRGRTAFADRNGNGIVDADREYIESRTLWDVTLSRTVRDALTLRVGAENLTDYTHPTRVPSLPGRQWFVELGLEL